MPPKQTTAASRGLGSASTSAAAGSSKSKPTSSSSRATKKPAKASRVANSDLSDLDVFAEDAEEEEVRAPRQKQQQRRHRPEAEDGAMDVDEMAGDVAEDDGADDDEAPETIPPDLLTRLLHEFFEKEGTRISRDANAAVAKYMDIFVRETIARTAVEKESGFLEVEDLEKVAPQLLLDL
ncbi:hypothetical protein DL766_004055 [Monosporascus sp. MC13-8B]|uniref:Centromere protein X n=1 Tax=Monosporascus cannonballus TaxID=155416 RepID=A0ABY0H0L6_9PEZI|nr:hypothetical protein DL762_007096 [Monosporascus cannonballus]RYO99134.1 hypothetical protein DL763_001735 [Monosporascus cannonballus]RYP32215.1 hypothetical protein DL766_004055 [Monosporascus sp. MC13-8B]